MSQRTRVRVDDAKNSETPFLLAQHAAGNHLRRAIESNMSDTSVAGSSGWQGCQHDRFALAAQAKQNLDALTAMADGDATSVGARPKKKKS